MDYGHISDGSMIHERMYAIHMKQPQANSSFPLRLPVAQPVNHQLWPRFEYRVVLSHAYPVTAMREDMQGKGHFVIGTSTGKQQAVLHRHGAIVGGVPEEYRWRIGVYIPVV